MHERKIRPNEERAIVNLINHHRQMLLREAARASPDGILQFPGQISWICTTSAEEIKANPNGLVQGYYRNTFKGVEKYYGDPLRTSPSFDKADKAVAEDRTACGERHELYRTASSTKEVKTNVTPGQPSCSTTLVSQPSTAISASAAEEPVEYYITGTVPASPTGTLRKPRTRRQAKHELLMANIVLPTDSDEDQELERPSPRPDRRRRKSALKEPRAELTHKPARRPPPPMPANRTGAATPDTSTDDDSSSVSSTGRSALRASTARA